MRKYFVVILLLILLPLVIFAATGNVAGKVVDKETGKPISNVTIAVEGTSLVTFSKDNGSFYIKNVPVGKQKISTKILGYKPVFKEVNIEPNLTKNIKFELERQAIQLKGIKISETRAVKRETPVAFTNVDEKQIQDKYTTEDVPLLLDNVPGLFSSAEGLGDAELSMRGFEADKIQVLINGIPVNDPESQKVYWSNWTGLSSNIKSVQVQRGASSSLYGSGVIGGSINIETMGSEAKRFVTFRTSYGSYKNIKHCTADGKGGFLPWYPSNYNFLLRYNSGNLFNGKFNFSAMVERKYGDSYIIGTKYDGYSFGLETQSLLGDHVINASFIGAPQHHNQARKTSDPYLFKVLGRAYNRDNHPYQENYYFKPQFSIRDEWDISDKGRIITNAFITHGSGGGKYLYNSTFNVDTGEIGFQDIKPESYQTDDFGKNAYYLYQNYGFILDGFNPSDSTMAGLATYTAPNGLRRIITAGASLFSAPAAYTYSFRNNSRNEHIQFGLNSYWKQKVNDFFTLIGGYEFRRWQAKHYALREKFRVNDYDVADTLENNVKTYENTQRRYDYNSTVTNLSGFVRGKLKFFDNKINLLGDVQYAVYSSKVEENPIKVFDYGYGKFTEYSFYMTKDIPKTDPDTGEIIRDENGNPIKRYSDDDYKKTFKFMSPKFGINFNATDKLNFMFNTSIAHKEPRVTEWYNRYYGPDASQIYYEIISYDTLDTGEIIPKYKEHLRKLKPETAKTVEFGIGYTSSIFDINLNGYYTAYEDKIASTEDDLGHKLTINAGKAIHKGLEFNTSLKYFNYDANVSATISDNKWGDMNFKKIFGIPAEEVSGKHVPYAPEKMLNTSIGYTYDNLPNNGKLRIGFDTKWWDNYWTNYTNEYEDYHADELAADSIDYANRVYYDENGEEIHIIKKAKLPSYFDLASSLRYEFKLKKTHVMMKVRYDNILNRDDNYTAGYYGADYNRYRLVEDEYGNMIKQKDALTSRRYQYVTPAPSYNIFFTLEVKFY